MKRSRFVDYLFNRSIERRKTEATKNSTNMNVRRNVYGEMVSERDLEFARENIGCHGGNLWTHPIKLKKAVNHFCT